MAVPGPFDSWNVCVYQSVFSGPLEDKLSALVITETGDVYGAGVNSLVACESYTGAYPILKGGRAVLESWVKIDELCGLGIKKIVVGYGFGAALTSSQLVTWGTGFGTFVDDPIVMFQEFEEDAKCQVCPTNHMYAERVVGNASLNYCSESNSWPPVYSLKSPPPEGIPVKRFVRFSPFYKIICEDSRECSAIKITAADNSFNLYHCSMCRALVEDEGAAVCLPNKGLPGCEGVFFNVSKLRHKHSYLDMSLLLPGVSRCSFSKKEQTTTLLERRFQFEPIFALLDTRKIRWHHFENNKLRSLNIRSSVALNRSEHVQAVCAGVLLLTESGKLYNHKFKELRLPVSSRVKKVWLGRHFFLCLLADNSIWIMRDLHNDGSVSWCKNVVSPNASSPDVAAVHMRDMFFIKGCLGITPGIAEMVFLPNDSNCTAALIEEKVCSRPIPTHCPAHVYHHMSSLYGETLFHDLSIHLSDGVYPAHRVVLFLTSNYFREILTKDPAPHTLDMTAFPCKAVKYLLKHYYNREPDDLNLEELLDLCYVANGFGEYHILPGVEQNIKANINHVHVARILATSREAGFETLIVECENYMRSDPIFRANLIEFAIERPSALTQAQPAQDQLNLTEAGFQHNVKRMSDVHLPKASQPESSIFLPGQSSCPTDNSSPPLHPLLSDLYGQTLFHDLTFLLSDGSFPAHRVVLCATSNYFRDRLVNAPMIRTMDMTEYPSKAFKCLMKYHYHLEPDALDLKGSLDLCRMASRFGESGIVTDVERRIKDQINADNVAQILTVSKEDGFQTLIAECERFMRSDPTFIDNLITLAIEKPSLLL